MIYDNGFLGGFAYVASKGEALPTALLRSSGLAHSGCTLGVARSGLHARGADDFFSLY